MAEQAGTVVWTITALTDSLDKAIKSAKQKIDEFKSETDVADKNVSALNQTLGNLSSSFSNIEKHTDSATQSQENYAIALEHMQPLQLGVTDLDNATEELSEALSRGTDEIDRNATASRNATDENKRFADALKDINQEAEENKKGIIGLTMSIGDLVKGFLALRTIKMLGDQLGEIIELANQSNRALAQTNAIVNATGKIAGVSATQVKIMADEIQATTAIQNDFAQAGINVLLQYTRIGEEIFPQATQAMIDMATAMAGGVPTMSQIEAVARQVGSALNDPIQGMGRLTQAGITFTEAEKDKVKALVESGNVIEAQNIILNRLAVFTGSAEAQAGTFEGQIAQTNNAFNDLRKEIGNAVLPAFSYLMQSLRLSGEGSSFLISMIQELTVMFIRLVQVVKTTGIVLRTVFSSIAKALTGDFEGAFNALKIGFEDIVLNAVTAQEAITDVYSKEAGNQTDERLSQFDNEELASGNKAQKIMEDLAEETEAYKEATAKRQLQFERSLADLVWAHQDKVKSLQEDLRTENQSYKEAVAKRTQEFHQSMADMEQSHLKKVETIEKQLAREIRKQEDKVAEVLALGKKQSDEEEKEYAKRVAIIESQIENELAKGEWANEEVLETLRRRLDNEEFIHQEKVNEIKDQVDDETKKIVDASQDRISDLEDRLKDEVEQNNKAIAEKIAKYEEETLALEQQHSTRVSNIRTTLEEELGILQAHQDSVDKVKDQAKLDDIARLKRQFEEQSVEEEKNHQKRLARIREEGAQAGQTSGTNFNNALRNTLPQISKTSQDIGNTIANDISRSSARGAKTGSENTMRSFIDGLIWTWENRKGELLNRIINALSPGQIMSNLFGYGTNKARYGYAEGVQNFGGGLALVGEKGPEIVNLPRGSDVIPNEVAFGEGGFGGGGSAIVNIGNVYEKSDVDMITRELGFKSSLMH